MYLTESDDDNGRKKIMISKVELKTCTLLKVDENNDTIADSTPSQLTEGWMISD